MVKPKPDVIARAVKTKEGVTTTNQALADEQIRIWESHWEVGQHPPIAEEVTVDPDYTDYTLWREPTKEEIDELRKTIQSFKVNTAVAYDNLRPKQVAWLSDTAISELIKLYWRCEHTGQWPSMWRNATMVMLPKADPGKWRLIAILPTPYRIWARHANRVIAQWIRDQDRTWVAYGPGCSAEGTTYEAALEAERHTGRYNGTVVTVVGDLEKGFEKVLHNNLVKAAKAYGLPMKIVRLALNMYRAGRRIRCGTAYSKEVFTNMGVLAGCPVAMVALMLSCIDPVEEFLRLGPRCLSVFKVYVDDFSLTFTFNERMGPNEVVDTVSTYYRKLDALLRRTGLKLSLDKNKSVTNKTTVAQILTKQMSDVKMASEKQLVKLGVDYAGGCQIKYTKANERLKKATAKRDAIMGYCKPGWKTFNVVRAHVVSAALYGATVHGVPPKQLTKIRTLMRSTTSSKAGGGSTTMVLALQKDKWADPAYRACFAPIREWAIRVNKAHYEGDATTKHNMMQAWEAHKRVVLTAADPWNTVCGPASATMASLIGIGWKPLSYKVWHTDHGHVVDLTKTIPYQVKMLAYAAIFRRLWETSSLAAEDDVGLANSTNVGNLPYLYPIRHVVLNTDPRLGGATRSVAANTQWTQLRLALTNYADSSDSLCRSCGENEGTLTHRNHPRGCPALQRYLNDWLGEAAVQYYDTNTSKMLVEHGIMMHREFPPCPEIGDVVDWESTGSMDHFTGLTGVDGSGKQCRYIPQLGRAGWGVSTIDTAPDSDEDNAEMPDSAQAAECGCLNTANPFHRCTEYCMTEHEVTGGNIVRVSKCDGTCNMPKHAQPETKKQPLFAMWGPLSGPLQTTPRAELTALIMAFKYGRSPQTILCDHLNHVRAINALCTQSGRRKVLDMMGPMLDLWRDLIAAVGTRGGIKEVDGQHCLRVRWQKAHLRASDGESELQKAMRRTNNMADIVANRGRAMHTDITNLLTRVRFLHDRAVDWARWVGFAAAVQYENGHTCDHDMVTERRTLTGVRHTFPCLPSAARIIRRFPWASRSLGIVEHSMIDNVAVPSAEQSLVLEAIGASSCAQGDSAYRVARFCERFPGSGRLGVRTLPPIVVPEREEWLPPDMALGHAMNTVGIFPLQFYWCEKCGSYTCERVRALKEPCGHRMKNNRAATRLGQGLHPITGASLGSTSRRITFGDVGCVPHTADSSLICDASPLSEVGD